ncbi:MAG: phosphoglucosamine mutase [Myxococcota bacterium]|nr:phosphoglucosamine mutase [Myxococcota bacterium]
MSDNSRNLFGTDGVRGTANVHPMTPEIVLSLGQAAAHVFRTGEKKSHRILIGKDTRLSGYMFEDALAAGISSMGVDVIQVGPIPTPGLAFLTVDMRCDAGVMITASHNPYQDNGVKFFGRDGFKLADDIEERIEGLVGSSELVDARAVPDALGRARRIDDAGGRYVVFLKNTFPRASVLDGVKVVLDCAHGAAYKVAPTVLEELGADVHLVGAEPDGRNINAGVGSLYPERIAEKVREVGADVGVALDGDADRVILVDETGRILDGDEVIAMAARALFDRKQLRGGGVVATVMSNLGLEKWVENLGLDLVRTPVGDRYVVEAMRRGGYNLGGEQSGHLVFGDLTTTGDGMITALQLLGQIVSEGRSLSELTAGFERFPQVLLNIEVAEKKSFESMPSLQAAIRDVESSLAGRGRVLIRYSGTESRARVMVEGEQQDQVEALAEQLADELRRSVVDS